MLAFNWYQKAAVQGEISAQINISNCYRLGYGVEKNLERAIHWAQQAAAQGDEEAINLLNKLTQKSRSGSH